MSNTTAERHKELFRIINIEGFSKNNTKIIDQYFAPNFIENQFGFDPKNSEGVKKVMAELHGAYPDFSMTIEDLVASEDGNTIWGRMTARGTQQGQIGPMPPTGRKMEITVVDIMRFRDEKIVEHWGVADRFAMMAQLGMQQPPKLLMKFLAFKNRRKK
ncbi:MAG: ester cyclase [Patescibacteria group bacterium]